MGPGHDESTGARATTSVHEKVCLCWERGKNGLETGGVTHRPTARKTNPRLLRADKAGYGCQRARVAACHDVRGVFVAGDGLTGLGLVRKGSDQDHTHKDDGSAHDVLSWRGGGRRG